MYIFTLRIPYAWARDISPVFAFEYKDGNVFDCCCPIFRVAVWRVVTTRATSIKLFYIE